MTELWQNIATTSIGVIVTMVGFWFTVGNKMATRAEVCELIDTKSLYVQDRQFIMERLNSNKEMQTAFTNALQKNTEVLNELKMQMISLSHSLKTLEERIERR